MSREDAIGYAAVCGVIGSTVLLAGILVSSLLFDIFDLWMAIIVSLIVWVICSYVGFKQLATGVYEIADEVTVDASN